MLLAVLFLAPNYFSFSDALYAQEPTDVELEITGVDVSSFPEIRVTVYGENLGINLAQLPIVVREDKAEQPLVGQGPKEVGVQTAFVFDASNNALGEYGLFTRSLDSLINTQYLTANTDWLAAFTTEGAASFRVIADWSRDHGAVSNQINGYTPIAQPSAQYTPLFELIEYVLDNFENSDAPDNVTRSIVVFSDGTDAVSDLDQRDVIRRAQFENIRIHTFMLFPGNPTRQSNLERISKLTNGTFFNSESTLTNLWSELQLQRTQMEYRYRLRKAQPVELEIEARVPNRQPIIRTFDFPVVPAEPAVIEIVAPDAGFIITRDALSADQPIEEILPNSLPIEIRLSWPDGNQRSLRSVEYSINDNTIIQRQIPPEGHRYDFAIGDLVASKYTLRITAIDELGIEAKSGPRAIEVQINIPPTPTPVPTETSTATSTPVPSETPTPTTTTIVITSTPDQSTSDQSAPTAGSPLDALLALALAALLGLLLFLYRRRKKREESDIPSSPQAVGDFNDWETSVPQDPYDENTEVPQNEAFPQKLGGYLIAKGDIPPNFPQRIPLVTNGPTRIGRKRELVDHVLEHNYISRKHATITHNGESFSIQDEGGTGGTYVNRQKLGAGDNPRLNPQDEISFYSFTYQFYDESATDVPIEQPGWDRLPDNFPDLESAPDPDDDDNTDVIRSTD